LLTFTHGQGQLAASTRQWMTRMLVSDRELLLRPTADKKNCLCPVIIAFRL
jgi:hypothetical protein